MHALAIPDAFSCKAFLQSPFLKTFSFLFKNDTITSEEIEEIRSYIGAEMNFLNECDELIANAKEVDHCSIQDLAEEYQKLMVCNPIISVQFFTKILRLLDFAKCFYVYTLVVVTWNYIQFGYVI